MAFKHRCSNDDLSGSSNPGNLSSRFGATRSAAPALARSLRCFGACILDVSQLLGGGGPGGPLTLLAPTGRMPGLGLGGGVSATWRMPFSEGWTVRAGAMSSRVPLPVAWLRRRWLIRSLTEGDAAVSERGLPSLEGEDEDEVARAGCAELDGLLKVGLWNFLGIE